VNRVIIYPYAHLSQNLARPEGGARGAQGRWRPYAREAGLETYRAPVRLEQGVPGEGQGPPARRAVEGLLALAGGGGGAAPGAPAVRGSSTERRAEMTEEQLFSRHKEVATSGASRRPTTGSSGSGWTSSRFQEPSPGMVYWHDKGWTLRNTLVDFDEEGAPGQRGYKEVSQPGAGEHRTSGGVSGHSEHYKRQHVPHQAGRGGDGAQADELPVDLPGLPVEAVVASASSR
jgi:hypothetical protein